MPALIQIRCGVDQHDRHDHQKVARRLMNATSQGSILPFQYGANVSFSAAALRVGSQDFGAVAVALYFDSANRLIPMLPDSAFENPVGPLPDRERAATVVAFVVGHDADCATVLCDTLPAYLNHVSGCDVVLALPADIGQRCGDALGLRRIAPPVFIPGGFISLRGDADPYRSVVARAIAYSKEGKSPFVLSSMGARSTIEVSVDDAIQGVCYRALEAWGGGVEPSSPIDPTNKDSDFDVPAVALNFGRSA
ncbi:MAG: hypothetical protein JNK07_18325 [Alphaproteobacteria bacterium]|nr:hypothetical protein [Alphaproteobacteria bacterium]